MTASACLRPLVLAFAFALPLAGCGDKSPESRIEAAKQALKKSDNKAAVIELKAALQNAPNNPEARLLLGQTFHATGQWDNSEKELRKAMELGVIPEQVLPMLAKTQVKMGKYEEVAELVIPSVGLNSLSLVSLQAEKANAFMALNKPSLAANAINEGEKVMVAVGGNNFSNDLQLAKARLAVVNKLSAQALALLDAALKRDAKLIDALYLKAQLLLAEGNEPEALKAYEQITVAKPDEALAYLTIVDLKLRDRDVIAAEKALQAAEKIDSNIPLLNYARARVYLSKGDLKQANEALQQVLRVAPSHLPSVILDAAVSYSLGNYEQSMKSANKVLGQMPEHFYMTKLVAANELRRGNTQDALNLLQRLSQTHPEDVHLLSMLGEANLQAKQYDKAMAYLDRAAALQPKDTFIKQGQARALLAQDQTSQAMQYLEEAVSLGEKPGRADLALITLHMGRNDFDKALQAIAVLEKKQPKNVVTSYLRGLALMGKNDRTGARKAFDDALAIRPIFFPAVANLARLDIEVNKPDAARQRFESLLKVDEKNTQAMLALAALAQANKDEKVAFSWLEKAAKADEKAIPPRVGLVRYYLANKKPHQALAIAREAASANPDSAEAHSLLGSTEMTTGALSSALSSFAKVSKLAPNSAVAFYQLGAAQVASERRKEGRASFEKALVLLPNHLDSLDALLLLDVAEKKFDLALQRARTFQAQHPKTDMGFVREADILSRQKQYAQAAKVYEQGFSRSGDMNVFSKMQGVLLLSGNQKLADQKIANLLSRFPKDVRVQSFAAAYYLEVGNNAESLRLYEGLQQTIPNDPTLLNNMAVLYQRMKDGRALQMAELAHKLAPEHPGIMDTLGWILVEQGQTARAIDLLKRALSQAPTSSIVRQHLATALAKAEGKAEAKQEQNELLKARE